jgi:hypothetical protein
MTIKRLGYAGTLLGVVAASMVAAGGAAHATVGDYLECDNAYKSTPTAGWYAACTLTTVDGLESAQSWSINGIYFASNTSYVTPGCGGAGAYYHIKVTYIDQGVADTQVANGICGGGGQ